MSEQQDIWALLAKKFSGEITHAEQTVLDELSVQASRETKKSIKEAEKVWSHLGTAQEYHPNMEEGWNSFQAKINRTTYPVGWNWVKIAASVLVLLSIGLLVYVINPFGNQGVVATHKIQQIDLPDGSKVWLNEGAQLAIRTFNERERAVVLEGEAFFDVASDPNKRFTIYMNSARIEVLGTSFNVNARDKNEVRVQVERGKVAFIPKKSRNPVVLSEGEEVDYQVEGSRFLTPQAIENPNFRAWQNKKINFRNSSMRVVAETIESYFDVEIEIAEELSNCRFTASFEDPTLTYVLEVISITGDFTVSEVNASYLIAGESCKNNSKIK